MPAGGSGGVSALQHRRDRQRGKRCLLATKAPPTPPQRWRARSKGVKQISMTICTTASTDVHSLCSRATSDPVAFQNKTRDQTEFPQFSVKRPFQDETSLTPADHEPGQWFAAYADRGLLSLNRRHSAGHQTTEVELVKVCAPSLATVSRADAQTSRPGSTLPKR